jgi:hypothetical protein
MLLSLATAARAADRGDDDGDARNGQGSVIDCIRAVLAPNRRDKSTS